MQSPAQHKILLLDDDQDLLELYREILGRLPSKPEIHTATSGARALALLAAHNFSLLLCDLKMPKMDGLQVLSIVRRRYPNLRTAVLTCLLDEQFRTRAYAMGIDLYLEKPSNSKEINFLLDCIESLLDRRQESGFRGIQSKSLVDIIQLECLSQSSSVLKVGNGILEGRIWIQQGEIIDASVDQMTGIPAFRKILSWQTGNFELLPAEPQRARTIFTSYQGLLLETAQALDEEHAPAEAPAQPAGSPASPLAALTHFPGVEFVVTVSNGGAEPYQACGLDDATLLAAWTQEAMKGFRSLGETLQIGLLNRLEGRGPIQNIAVASRSEQDLCAGFHRSLSPETVRTTLQSILSQWAS
jgi:CheY-like chemotaxis protein